MEQRDSTCHAFGPRYSTGTEGGRGNERKGGSLQLRKGGVHIETDRAVALLGFAFSPGSQAARRATPAIPRSQVACGALTGEITAIWAFFGCFLPEIAEISAISGVDAGTGEKNKRSLVQPENTSEHTTLVMVWGPKSNYKSYVTVWQFTFVSWIPQLFSGRMA